MYGHVRPRPPWERDIPQAKSGKGLPKHVMKERLRDAADPHPLPANGPPAPWKKLEVAHSEGHAKDKAVYIANRAKGADPEHNAVSFGYDGIDQNAFVFYIKILLRDIWYLNLLLKCFSNLGNFTYSQKYL